MTLFIPKVQFLFGFKLPNKQPQSIVKIFDWLEKRIGHRNFRRLFGLLLTDQGSEFLKFDAICKSVYDSYTSRCKIFYCDPKSPNQKPHVENIHTLLRRFIPKSRDIDNYTQDD
ncbi:helix-turn-helix domain containing protein, partial [Fusobacterium nucleatum]